MTFAYEHHPQPGAAMSALDMVNLKRDHPELWDEIADYHRWSVLNELWRESDKNTLATRGRESARWLVINDWIGGHLAAMAEPKPKEQMERMMTDPDAYFAGVRSDAKRRSRGVSS